MSTRESRNAAEREPASHVVAGYLAAAVLFVSPIAIVYKPGQIGPGAMLVALVAAAMGGPHQRLAAVALTVAGVSWLTGMTLAIWRSLPIF